MGHWFESNPDHTFESFFPLQYYAALKNNVDSFISSDKKLKKAGIPQSPVYTAQELLFK